jgi:hypothetical protein
VLEPFENHVDDVLLTALHDDASVIWILREPRAYSKAANRHNARAGAQTTRVFQLPRMK